METALLVENSESLEYNLELLDFLPKTYSPDFALVTETMVDEVHNMNMKLVPWTVNEITDMERLLKLGVDGLISDYPDRLLALKNKILNT
jgi:glycerophosphoryl diester phosphodiesterase